LTVGDNSGWKLTLSENFLLDIEDGTSRTVTLTVTIPDNAENCARDRIIITATSTENAAMSDSATCVAHCLVRPPFARRGVQVSISPYENSAENGETVTFVVTITNTGNVAENYDLSETDDAGWGLTLQSSVTVPSGENIQVTLSVGIPAAAANDTRDNITVTATSTENAAMSDSASCTAHCVVNVTPPSPGTSPLIYVGAAVVIVVIIAVVLVIKPS
jgi:uncharacterized repeat protein (TIGR01451 family)